MLFDDLINELEEEYLGWCDSACLSMESGDECEELGESTDTRESIST